ncbi:hypothetical protein [Paenibacillus sp. ISL-20]|uniref:hypothetical protein n=1 Tax=Paenibacillus sp. ISL-20 TaxID=2819163 RepID=UPI001BE4F5A7|nr:hypothetical protein [Paenibacillus sp. ISL-20]MBT2759908.1 hypothetical protein [Paenibacillus sp. ISL-20]
MFEAFIYILASCLEGVAFFVIAFGLFRIRIAEYIKEVIITIVVVSLGTFLLSDHQLVAQFIPFINLITLIIFLIFFFRVSVPHTILIVVSGYIACMILQWGLIKVIDLVAGVNLMDIQNSISLRTFVQILNSTLIIIISMILRKFSLWFTFVPYSTSINFKMTKHNLTLLLVATTILFVFGMTLKYSSLFFGFTIWIICLTTLMAISLRREYHVD